MEAKILFEIISDSDFLYNSEGQTFTCGFYCLTENDAFPDVEWTDFGQNVLSWWSNEILRNAHGENVAFQLLFEDGPFWIDCRKHGNTVTLHFNTSKRGIKMPPDQQMSFGELACAVEKAMRKLSTALFLSGNVAAAEQMQREILRFKAHGVM